MTDDRSLSDRRLRAKLADGVRDALDDVPEAARGAFDTGRDLYRRGAMAVTRTAGDNGALMLLAGGAAVAGLSWLWLRAREHRR
ncbi:hypothetical protein [Sphingomonas sp.]|uniref:hypothetical protein n=1 Tax=Sphingomonas sp. TaxID=28214 RepID=UPI003B0032E4